MTHIIGKPHEPDWQWKVTTPVLVEIVDLETGETVLDPDTEEPLMEPQLDVNGDPVMEPWRPPGRHLTRNYSATAITYIILRTGWRIRQRVSTTSGMTVSAVLFVIAGTPLFRCKEDNNAYSFSSI